jgi:hypothetical protein
MPFLSCAMGAFPRASGTTTVRRRGATARTLAFGAVVAALWGCATPPYVAPTGVEADAPSPVASAALAPADAATHAGAEADAPVPAASGASAASGAVAKPGFTIDLQQGLGESPRERFYRMTVESDGRVELRDEACPTPAVLQLGDSELRAVTKAARDADLPRLARTYLPRGESDRVGAPHLTLRVTPHDGAGTVIEFDAVHAPRRLLALETVLHRIADRLAPTCPDAPAGFPGK